MANAFETLQSRPLHLENSVMAMGKRDLQVGQSFHTYRDMKLDGVIGGSMSYLKALLSKPEWKIEYPDKATQVEIKTVDALNKSLNDLEGYDKRQLMGNLLASLDYGCSLNEVVYKRDAGKMVFDTISPIHLTTVAKFTFSKGSLKEVKVTPADNDGLIDFGATGEEVVVKGDKLLMLALEQDADFPLGKSVLYGAYTGWKAKQILQEYEAIGVAKNLSGVLSIKVPSEYLTKYHSEPGSDEAKYLDSLLMQAEMLHAGKGSYVVSPSDTQQNGVDLFRIETIGGTQGQAYDVGGAINRYNDEIMLAMQASILALGNSGGGSFALSDSKTLLLTMFVMNIQAAISAAFRRAVRQAFVLNGLDPTRAKGLVFEELEPMDWDDFTRGWQRLVQSGAVTPDQPLEAYLRKAGGAPEADYATVLDTASQGANVQVVDNQRIDDGKQA